MHSPSVPGPDLAAALAARDLASVCDPNECLDLVLDWDRMSAWVLAGRAAGLARFCQLDSGSALTSSDQEYALAARLSTGQAGYDLYEAELLDGALVSVRDALAAGGISPRHSRVICSGLRPLLHADAPLHKGVDPAEAARVLAERISDYAASHTPSETRARLRRWLLTADVQSAEQRHQQAMADLDVTHDVGDDGVGYLTVSGRVDHTLRIFKSIDAAARADATTDRSDHHSRPRLGRRRSDLAMELLLDACRPSRDGSLPRFATNVVAGSDGATGEDVRLRSLVPVPAEPEYHPSMDKGTLRFLYGQRGSPEGEPCDRTIDRGSVRATDRAIDRDVDQAIERGIERDRVRAIERGIERDRVRAVERETADGVPPWSEDSPPPPPYLPPVKDRDEWIQWFDSLHPQGISDYDDPRGLEPTDRAPVRGRFLRSGVRPYQVNVTVDLPTLLGVADNPALLDGVVPITPTHVRLLFTASDFRRFLVESQSGELLELGAKTYRPSDDVALFARSRDPVCRVPGCERSAQTCQLDHEVAFDHADPERGGPTVAGNLGPLCQRHHQLKTHGGWDLARMADNQLELVSPKGRRYLVAPHDHRTTGPAAA